MKRWVRKALQAAVACAAVVGSVALAVPAAAADELIPVPENGAPGLLWLSSSVYPLEFPALAPGDSFTWQIGLVLGKPEATAALQLASTGGLAGAGGYVVAVDECASLWQGSSGRNQQLECPSASRPRIPATALNEWNQGLQIPLSDLRSGTSRYLRFTLTNPVAAEPLEGASLTLGIGITAMGDGDGDTPDGGLGTGPLGDTGARSLPALFAGGGLVLLGGALMALLRRTRGAPDHGR